MFDLINYIPKPMKILQEILKIRFSVFVIQKI